MIRNISAHEMVLPLPPEKFGGHRVGVVGAYLLWYWRIPCGICGSPLVFHSWYLVPGMRCGWSMSQTEVWSGGGAIVPCSGVVLEAVYGVTRFVTKAGDCFSSDKLDVEFRTYRSRRPSWGLHGSQEHYSSFCPVDGWVMTDQPVVTEDNRVSFI